MSERVVVPGPRDVRATLDSPAAEACVVACPPHPQQGGRRTDRRLGAVSRALGESGVACLRFDYGPWDEGTGERRDAAAAVGWANGRFEAVALVGYSFGATVALAAAPDRDTVGRTSVRNFATPGWRRSSYSYVRQYEVCAVSALAPAASTEGLDPVAALDRSDVPVQVVCGARDAQVDCAAVAERARDRGHEVVEVDAGHGFAGAEGAVGEHVAAFVDAHRP